MLELERIKGDRETKLFVRGTELIIQEWKKETIMNVGLDITSEKQTPNSRTEWQTDLQNEPSIVVISSSMRKILDSEIWIIEKTNFCRKFQVKRNLKCRENFALLEIRKTKQNISA